MATRAFVDESVRKGYFVCAVVVAVGDLTPVRRDLRALRKPGAARIHMATERPQFRRQVLSAINGMPVRAHIYEAAMTARSQRAARNDCLHALVGDLVDLGVDQVVFESCDQDRQDRIVMAAALRKAGDYAALSYNPGRPTQEELLWLPDMIAWAHGAGGDWRRRVEPLIDSVRRIRS